MPLQGTFLTIFKPKSMTGLYILIFSIKRTVVESVGFGSCWRLTKPLRILSKSTVQQTLHRPISTEGFKLLNRLYGWSTFTQISLLKTTTLFSSASGNIYILLTHLMPQQFCSCRPPKHLHSGCWSGCPAWKTKNSSLGSTKCGCSKHLPVTSIPQ